MWLLHVETVVRRDMDIVSRKAKSQTEVLKKCDNAMTPYAILSHRWQDEVGYNEMIDLMELQEDDREKVMDCNGYRKILASCRHAMSDDLEWLWVDTCCIDKRSSSELSEAINSMYWWYENSTKCYAYLHDVDSRTFPTEQNFEKFGKFKGWPEWFSRGWTLQELIAPGDVQFFNKEWAPIGNKRDLAGTLEKITHIPKNILISGLDSGVRSAAQIMSWAADRETTRVEDRAYSLLGLFGVHMPMLYGEGKGAFQRLQLEIIRSSNDHSIFAWDPEGRIRRCGSVLADDPSYFRDCNGIWSVEPEWFVQWLKSHMQYYPGGVTGRVSTLLQSAILPVRRRANLVKEFSTCSIASGGLQISLPIVPYPGSSSLFRATLGCAASLAEPPMTIDLVSDSTRYYRFFGAKGEPTTFPRVGQLFLSYRQDESRRKLTLDDKTVSFYDFTRCGTFPCSIVGNVMNLSLTNDLIVVVYANDKADIRFAVGFGHFLGSAWTHVTCDESRDTSWEDFAKKAYNLMWNWRSDLAGSVSDHDISAPTGSDGAGFIKHAHLPRSIWAVRIMWGVWYRGNCKVTIDVVLCSGCCRGPLAWETWDTDWNGVETPGPMQAANPPSLKYGLYMDGVRMQLYSPNIPIKLGDYGRYNPTFECEGNIFQDLAKDPAYNPVKRSVSSETMIGDIVTVLASDGFSELRLQQPVGLSLPNNQQLVLLLKALSPRLVDKRLVTSVVHDGTETLCYISVPQVWCRDVIDKNRRSLLKEIREQFYTLLNWSRPTTPPSDSRSPVSGKLWFRGHSYKFLTRRIGRQQAIKYFSDLFGTDYFESYVGKTMFFEKLPASLELNPNSETSEVVQDFPVDILAKTLHGRKGKVNTILGQRMQGVKREIGALSKTLGVRLLQEMATVYNQTYDKLCPLKDGLTRKCMDYDLSKSITEYIDSLPQPTTVSGHDSICGMVHDIKTLQTELDGVENTDEQLALEEDVTGRILWACHFGLRSSVGHIPAKVLCNVLENDQMYDLIDWVKFLEDISTVFNESLAEMPTDHQAHLRRIMADAEVGTSKYQLLLDERRCQQRVPSAMQEG